MDVGRDKPPASRLGEDEPLEGVHQEHDGQADGHVQRTEEHVQIHPGQLLFCTCKSINWYEPLTFSRVDISLINNITFTDSHRKHTRKFFVSVIGLTRVAEKVD